MGQRGRPSIRTPEMIDEIIERLSAGEPLAQICRDEGMPSLSTVYAWQESDAEFSANVARARECGEHVIAQDALDLVDAPAVMTSTQFGEKVDSGDVALRKLKFDARMKLLACWNSARWGTNRHEIAGPGGSPILVSQVDPSALSDATLSELLNARRRSATDADAG